MEQENDDHQRDDDRFLDERAAQRVDRFPDEPGAIVGRHDFHARRQRSLHVAELGLDTFDHAERVLAEAHDDDAADHFAFAVQFGDAPSNVGADAHLGHVAHAHRRAALSGAERDIFDVVDRLQVAPASHHVLAP